MNEFSPYDWFLAGTLVLFGSMAVMHDLAGWRVYVQGKAMGPLRAGWTSRGIEDRCLLGVFFTASLAWGQYVVLMLALLLTGNSLGGWVGVIALAFVLPQLLLALRFVAWDWVAKWIYILHLTALVAWTLDAFRAG
jgi:hypothetical protein